jgi:hypothetical protein
MFPFLRISSITPPLSGWILSELTKPGFSVSECFFYQKRHGQVKGMGNLVLP